MALESFVLQKSYYNAIAKLPEELKSVFIAMLCDYMFNDKQPSFEEYPILSSFWDLVIPMVEAYNASRKNGSRGGRPKKINK